MLPQRGWLEDLLLDGVLRLNAVVFEVFLFFSRNEALPHKGMPIRPFQNDQGSIRTGPGRRENPPIQGPNRGAVRGNLPARQAFRRGVAQKRLAHITPFSRETGENDSDFNQE